MGSKLSEHSIALEFIHLGSHRYYCLLTCASKDLILGFFLLYSTIYIMYPYILSAPFQASPVLLGCTKGSEPI